MRNTSSYSFIRNEKSDETSPTHPNFTCIEIYKNKINLNLIKPKLIILENLALNFPNSKIEHPPAYHEKNTFIEATLYSPALSFEILVISVGNF